MPTKIDFIDAMAKHLPPSASDLRLLDIGGLASDILEKRRPDIHAEVASLVISHWAYPANSVDAVVAYDNGLQMDLLAAILQVMRPGGRLIVINPIGEVDARWVEILETAGYIRILVEPAVGAEGVLIRGEKAHTTDNTLDRIEMIAERDADLLNLETYRGRYIHLLIVQTPNVPIWKRQPTDKIEWHAIAVQQDDEPYLLAFSSLPKAVNFMQSAVLAGFIHDVNKVGKFSKAIAAAWQFKTRLNPTLSQVENQSVLQVSIDPDTAEISDE
ncbi:MAG: hypothetical protein WBC91_07010 [Phototrophicaceae bacterium]